ncbi:MAG: YaiO family outer membrane beta-barrel protein, partial [Gallionellaceae bacterium]
MKYLTIMSLIVFHALASTVYAQGEAPIQVEVGSSLDTFDKTYIANWRSNYVEAEKKLGERHAVYGVLREVERYSKKDTEFLAGYYYPLANRWTLFTEGNASPSHNILANWSGIGQVQYAFDKGIGGHLGLRHTEYDSAVINILLFTCERYWSNYRAAYTHSTSSLANAGYASNERIQLSRYYDDR